MRSQEREDLYLSMYDGQVYVPIYGGCLWVLWGDLF